jgi:hypothetical protein
MGLVGVVLRTIRINGLLVVLALYCAGCGEETPPDGDVPEPDGSAPVVLNELLASNDTVLADEAGEFDDWLELHNKSEVEVDLGGWLLSGGPRSAEEPFVLPAGTSIEAGGYLVVWADNDPEQGDLHTDFKLARIGETLVLYLSAGEAADSVTFPEQQADVSWARQPDASGEWQASASPSPGAANN